MRSFSLILCFLLSVSEDFAAPLVAPEVNSGKTGKVRVLFVGNSYSYADDIPWITVQLAAANKGTPGLEVEMIAFPGATLQSHWEKGEAVARLHRGKWNFVVLQEQSSLPIEAPDLLQKYTRLFDKEIRSVGATPVIFLTWPRREHPEKLDSLTNAYFSVAKELNASVAPVGVAWNEVLKRKPSLPLYHQDGSHPNPIGSYLAACVFYSVFFQKSPAGLPRTLYTVDRDGSHRKVGELTEGDAAVIQRAAWESVQKTAQPKR